MQRQEMQLIQFLHLHHQEVQFTQLQILHYYIQKREVLILILMYKLLQNKKYIFNNQFKQAVYYMQKLEIQVIKFQHIHRLEIQFTKLKHHFYCSMI
jgi:hypothetical protein